MSAYFVDKPVIDAVVIAFQELFARTDNSLPAFPDDARTKLGKDLWTMNMQAVGDRYAHNPDAMAEQDGYQAEIDAYVFSTPAPGQVGMWASGGQAQSACRELRYQCSEDGPHDVPGSKLFKSLDALADELDTGNTGRGGDMASQLQKFLDANLGAVRIA